MKSRFITDPHDPLDSLLDSAWDQIYASFSTPGTDSSGNPSASTPVAIPPTALTDEAIQAQNAQSASTTFTLAAATSGGITINLLFDSAALTAPASFRAGIEQAASILTGAISDKITVNIRIDYSGIGGGAAAGPQNGLYESYSSVKADLLNNATSGDTTFKLLPGGSTFQGQTDVAVWNAQLKLFGLLGANDTTTDDGAATFATDISPSLLVGVALHELTHAMGRVPYGPVPGQPNAEGPQPDIFDFFRFTSPGTRLIEGGGTAPAAYFSMDGGNTKLADYGQTSDASDFLNSGVQGYNDPFNEFYSDSTSQTLTAIDKAQLDALGFHTAWAPPDLGPVAIAAGFAAVHGQNISASSLFSITDSDGESITAYQLWDSTTDPSSGHWVVDGVAQGKNVAIDVSPAQLSSTTFQTGSGSNDLWVRANDGTMWGAWIEFHVNAPVDYGPVATAGDYAATHSQNISAASLFSATDAYSDPITAYQLWDSTTDPNSGHWVVNGVTEGKNVAIDVSPAQLSNTTFQSGSGSNDLWVRASDGTLWGAWTEFHVNAPVDHGPVTTAGDYTATHGQNISASSLFSVTDAYNDPITAYQLWDSTTDPTSGHWVVSGAAQGKNAAIDVSPAQLSGTTFQSGSGSNDLWVRANDGFVWGAWKEFHVNAPVDYGPVATAADYAATHGQNISAASLFSETDADHDPVTAYQLWDSTTDPNSGHWVANGVAQGKNAAIDVSPAQLSGTTFQSGSGSNDLWVRANDGFVWGAWKEFHVNAPVDHGPVATATDYTATPNQNISASSLFSVTDAYHDPITAYQLWDSTSGPGSGHWVVNGAAQGANVAIDVSAAQLPSASFHSGTGSDDLWVRANDGIMWGAWTEFHVLA
jgi:hypothetical protein